MEKSNSVAVEDRLAVLGVSVSFGLVCSSAQLCAENYLASVLEEHSSVEANTVAGLTT